MASFKLLTYNKKRPATEVTELHGVKKGIATVFRGDLIVRGLGDCRFEFRFLFRISCFGFRASGTGIMKLRCRTKGVRGFLPMGMKQSEHKFELPAGI